MSVEHESPERPKVFGVGMMKTGTSTLGAAFTWMGYNHRSYYPKLIRQLHRGETDQLWDVADRYESFEDNPWPMVVDQIDERYPDAKFVLTTRRDSATWYRSLERHAKRNGPTAERYMIYGYGWPARRRDEHIEAYERHNDAVRARFADRPGKLLDVCWETGSTVVDVADFLGADASHIPTDLQANVGDKQGIFYDKWVRNTAKYVLIGRLGIDPWRSRGFVA